MDKNEHNLLKLPDFLAISPSKCGTNTLFELLSAHPQLCMAKHVKGTRFFNRFYSRGIEWYSGLFSHCPSCSVKGEVDETYFLSGLETAEKIFRHLPDVKIIVCLRSPVNRAWSLYLQFCKFGLLKGSFWEVIKDPLYYKLLITDNYYDEYLLVFKKYFETENIFLLTHEEFTEQMQSTILRIYSFLDVDPSFVPQSLNKNFNPASQARFASLNRILYFALIACRHLGLNQVISCAKRSILLRKLLFSRQYGQNYPSIPDDVREYLQGMFDPHIKNLAQSTNLDLEYWIS